MAALHFGPWPECGHYVAQYLPTLAFKIQSSLTMTIYHELPFDVCITMAEVNFLNTKTKI